MLYNKAIKCNLQCNKIAVNSKDERLLKRKCYKMNLIALFINNTFYNRFQFQMM